MKIEICVNQKSFRKETCFRFENCFKLTLFVRRTDCKNLCFHLDQFHSARFWIGGNDIAQTGTYIWEGTQLPLNAGYTNYYQGSPDNGGDNLEEHCMEMSDRYNYEWNDNECKSKFYPICEMR